jgi:two-component system sensor histidine kinase DesK
VGGAVRAAYAGYWIGALTVAGVVSALLSPWEPGWMLAGVAVMTPIIGFVNLHYSETRRRDASLRLAQDEIARLATIAERERIAGDLHDLLGHTLSVIVLKSQLASKLVTIEPARAASEIAEIEGVARDALTEVRRAVHGFRSATLRDELTRARAVLQTAGIDVRIQESEIAPLPRDVEHAAAMILREAVTNVVRHSQAAQCEIDVQQSDGQLVVRVADDGVGGVIAEGSGIESMRARARDIGGTFEQRRRSEGTSRGMSVTLRAPLGRLA